MLFAEGQIIHLHDRLYECALALVNGTDTNLSLTVFLTLTASCKP